LIAGNAKGAVEGLKEKIEDVNWKMDDADAPVIPDVPFTNTEDLIRMRQEAAADRVNRGHSGS
jgi:hypothetical protein